MYTSWRSSEDILMCVLRLWDYIQKYNDSIYFNILLNFVISSIFSVVDQLLARTCDSAQDILRAHWWKKCPKISGKDTLSARFEKIWVMSNSVWYISNNTSPQFLMRCLWHMKFIFKSNKSIAGHLRTMKYVDSTGAVNNLCTSHWLLGHNKYASICIKACNWDLT